MSATARRLELAHAAGFDEWLQQRHILERKVAKLGRDLEIYLLDRRLVTSGAGAQFQKAVPLVIERCDDDIYGDQAVADAYAWVHLLERYRRAWLATCALFRAGRLPLARQGLEVLDVGTGPAPVLYAISDFHAAVREFAEERGIEQLRLPPPHLGCVEQSAAMMRLVHWLSEIGERQSGPLGADFPDIVDVDPEQLRARRRRFEVARLMEEEDIGDERIANQMVSEAGLVDSSFRYRLAVFSNFLTTSDSVRKWQEPLVAVSRALYPGGLMFVMGAVEGRKYEQIYTDLAALMSTARLKVVDELPETLSSEADTFGVQAIKRLWIRVWSRLEELSVADRTRLERWPELWDPNRWPKGKRFAVRAFRRAGGF
jgi:hypothetical protein